MPAIVWRGGAVSRGAIVGLCLGLFFGVLAWLDSGMPITGAIVFVVLGVGSGVWMARRMRRYWPGSAALTGDQRVAVVSAARSGTRVDDAALAPAVGDYSRGLRAAAEDGRAWRWLVVSILLVAVAMAVWDAAYGSWGNLIVSVVYLVLVALELFWWPKKVAGLLANADQATSKLL